MTLASGSKLLHYDVLGPLGAGAMGEVYRARDTRLDREVAIKVLPEHFGSDAERLRRFEREAKSLATLNHPNIAQIHGVDQSDDTYFLVLELVEGETLEDRLKRGPLAVAEALDVCRQIAEGLEAAHEAGVIHRDLKPANVRITPDGKVKLLDFGLARPARAPEGKSATDSVLSTEAGRLLGTPTYMAPEQARGKPIDKRVDVWAFGCVLFECLTARRAFDGETLSDVLAAVLEREPDFDRLPAETPAHVRALLARCLVKDPRRRLRDIGDARLELEPGAGDARDAARPGRAGVPPLLVALGVALAVAATWFAVRAGAPAQRSAPMLRLEIGDAGFWSLSATAIAPDGSRIVFSSPATSGLGPAVQPRVRPLDRFEARDLANSLLRGLNPFFSPDGTHVACFAEQGLVSVELASGSLKTIAGSEDWAEGSWTSTGGIVFSRAHVDERTWPGLAWVAAEGGPVRTITTVAPGEVRHTWPEVLPDGRTVLFNVVQAQTTSIAVGSVDGGAHRILIQGAGRARYSPTGHLLFCDSRGRLLAVRFDARTATIAGDPIELAEEILALPEGGWAFDISAEGTLVYTDNHASDALARQVVVLDREGNATPLISEITYWAEPRLSPDGQFLAVRRVAVPDCALWVLERKRGLLSRVPVEGDVHNIAWSADGKYLLFRLDHRGRPRICRVAADGTGSVEEISHAEVDLNTATALPDGSGYLCSMPGKGSDSDIVLLDAASGEVRPLLATPANEGGAMACPDGRWFAYVSDESGRFEVYLRSLPDAGHRLQVSQAGGSRPRWLRDGKALFFVSEDRLMHVTVGTDPTLEVSAPATVFPESVGPSARMEYDVTPDGKNFVTIRGDSARKASILRVVLGWPRLLEPGR